MSQSDNLIDFLIFNVLPRSYKSVVNMQFVKVKIKMGEIRVRIGILQGL